jgi:hypothetical protein
MRDRNRVDPDEVGWEGTGRSSGGGGGTIIRIII